MKQKYLLIFFFSLVLAMFFSATDLFAQRGGRAAEVIEIKLASPLPENSDWGYALKRLAVDWAKATNNEVKVTIIHNGIEGGEGKMLSSLSSNNIQAALFSSFGLSYVCPSAITASMPFNIKNDGELNAVFDEVTSFLDNQASKTNFHILAYSKAGWVNIYSKEKVFTPDDLRKLRIASNIEAEQMNNTFKTMGFNVVETDWVDVGPKINSNAVNAIYQIAPVVAANQLHRYLGNMMSLPIAPVIGGIVINRVTWNKINPAYQQELMRITRRYAADFDANMPRTAANSVSAMTRNGLTVNQISSAQEELWKNEIQRVMPLLIGGTFDRELYEKINAILTRYRSGGR